MYKNNIKPFQVSHASDCFTLYSSFLQQNIILIVFIIETYLEMLNKLIVACRNNDAKGGEVSLNANYADIEIK